MSEIMKDTDFIGFSFNNIHSSELGIVRTSDGSRFNENLLPVISDKVVQAPGADGSYYFGSNYTHRVFDVPFAFDNMTEEQFQRFKKWIGDKKIHDLVFDERPYKIYRAKITGSATIKHIPFREGKTNRIYKGEGSIQFTAFDPFARSAFKYLNQASEAQLARKSEWQDAANMLNTQDKFDHIRGTGTESRYFNLYNPGDKEADFLLSFSFYENKIPAASLIIDCGDQIYKLGYSEITSLGDDEIKINSKLNLIEGYKNGVKSGNIYNQYITEGEFFKIPMTTEKNAPLTLQTGITDPIKDNYNPTLVYDYYYL